MKSMKNVLLLVAATLVAGSALAADMPAATTDMMTEKPANAAACQKMHMACNGDKACEKQVEDACKKAGIEFQQQQQ